MTKLIYLIIKGIYLFFLLPLCMCSKHIFDKAWNKYYTEFLPKNISKKNPTTVGGSTKGRVNTISNIYENLFILKTAKAIYIPTKKVIMVE